MTQLTIEYLLESAIRAEASDIHLSVNKPPIFRVHGEMAAVSLPPLTAEDLNHLILKILNEYQKEAFARTKELDFSYRFIKDYQCRVNLCYEKGNVCATIRIISSRMKTIAELGLPSVIDELVKKREGLIILSGTAGSGKSTTFNYLINQININHKCKIITIEDPIEYFHDSKKSLIIQREVGVDTKSFASALKYSLRQDPDVVAIGEMRDLESISMAMTTAETGHLVITTVHAPDAIETINRIIDVYPVGQKDQICTQLAENLAAVICQKLVSSKDSAERILATEVLMATLPIRNIIRRQALVELRGQMDASTSHGMHSFEKCLSDLVKKGLVSPETAKENVKNIHSLEI